MNFYYLIPTESITQFGQTVNAPKYVTELGLPFSAIPNSGGIALVSLASDNASIDGEGDVLACPSDLTAALADADVSNLSSYLQNFNVANTWIVAGMTWAAALRQIATIFLTGQLTEFDGPIAIGNGVL